MTAAEIIAAHSRPSRTIDHQALGHALKMLRVENRWHQYAIANKLGVDPATLSLLEGGKRQWTEEKVAAFLEAVGG